MSEQFKKFMSANNKKKGCSDSQGSSLHPSIKFLAIVRDSSLTKGSSQHRKHMKHKNLRVTFDLPSMICLKPDIVA
jgi:hypothetical protein